MPRLVKDKKGKKVKQVYKSTEEKVKEGKNPRINYDAPNAIALKIIEEAEKMGGVKHSVVITKRLKMAYKIK